MKTERLEPAVPEVISVIVFYTRTTHEPMIDDVSNTQQPYTCTNTKTTRQVHFAVPPVPALGYVPLASTPRLHGARSPEV